MNWNEMVAAILGCLLGFFVGVMAGVNGIKRPDIPAKCDRVNYFVSGDNVYICKKSNPFNAP